MKNEMNPRTKQRLQGATYAIRYGEQWRVAPDAFLCVPVDERREEWIGPYAREGQDWLRNGERVLASGEPDRRAKKPRVLPDVGRCRVGEPRLRRTPVRVCRDASGARPRRDQELCRLARRRQAAWQHVPQCRAVVFRDQLHAARFMDQALITAEAPVGVLERCARQHRVKVHVNGTQVGVFCQVEPDAIVAGRFRRASEQTHTSAHGHARVGIIECRRINADRRQQRRRVVAETSKAG